VTDIIKENGKRYAIINGHKYRLTRVFACNECGAEAEGGSSELLDTWSKTAIIGIGDNFTVHHCASCTRERT
jgi:transcription elongation factor Elf1